MQIVNFDEVVDQITTLNTATTEINKNLKSLDMTWYTIALILKKVKDYRLYEEEGFHSFEEYISEKIEYSKSMIYKILKVAKCFVLTDEKVREVGIAKLILLSKLNTDEAIIKFLDTIDIFKISYQELKIKLDYLTAIDTNDYFKNYDDTFRQTFFDINDKITSFKNVYNRLKTVDTLDEKSIDTLKENTNELIEYLNQLQGKLNNL